MTHLIQHRKEKGEATDSPTADPGRSVSIFGMCRRDDIFVVFEGVQSLHIQKEREDARLLR